MIKKFFVLSLSLINRKTNNKMNTKIETASENLFDEAHIPLIMCEARINNDIILGDFFKLRELSDFIIQVNIWDVDTDENRKEVATHYLYIESDTWKEIINFPQAEQMRIELAGITYSQWTDFVFHYTRLFNKTHSSDLFGLRFRRSGVEGKTVKIGVTFKNLDALVAKFA